MNPLLEGLNPEQAAAVTHRDGPLLILAGAGSGKTRVLTRRIAYLVESGVRPWNLLAVTFTNKAAGEMKERVAHLVGPQGAEVWVSTFHSSCVRILRRDIEPLGWGRNFAIWDDDDQGRVLKALLTDLKIDLKRHPPAMYRSRIDRAKNALKGPDDVPEEPGTKLREVFRRYEARLKASNALDFNDIINKVVALWETDAECLARWQDKFRYLLVDEYQDTNAAQYRLLRLLAAKHRNLAVVGDDDQSIYSFRGADIRNILDFEKDFPDARVVRLEQNYRSTGNILLAASAVVKNNLRRKDKTLRTDQDMGDPLVELRPQDEDVEADVIVAEIRRLLPGRRYADFAVLYRMNSQSRALERALTQARMPYVLVGGRKFYERREVRDVLAYLRLLLNPADDMSFLRILNAPARGLGEKAEEAIRAEAARRGVPLLAAARELAGQAGRMRKGLESLVGAMDAIAAAARTLPPDRLVMYAAEVTGYLGELRGEETPEAQGRIENVEELARAVGSEAATPGADPMTALMEFVDRASLSAQADELPDDGAGAVTLLTVHLAKGLEYPVVFIAGMTEGAFPHARMERDEEIEEERRLAYVALTRARERLYVSAPQRRMVFGEGWQPVAPSRFLMEIPPEAFGRAPRRPGAAPLRAPLPPPRAPAPPARPGGAPSPFGRPPARPASPLPGPPRLTGAAPPEGGRRMLPESPDAFRTGARVWHPLLGVGTILRREGESSNPRLTIHFNGHGPRTVFAISARMEILLD